MTFIRLDALPLNEHESRKKALERWESDEGHALAEHVTQLIREGAGEDFLQYEFENGQLGFLGDQWDLAGLQLLQEEITFPKGDNFENIDFSYAKFWHSTFSGACFPQTHFHFSRLYNVTFRDCLFALAHFYGCTLEKCKFENCDFVEGNGFSNCDMVDTTFQDCFMFENIYKDCQFNENVDVINKNAKVTFGLLSHAANFGQDLKPEQISGIYQGIKDGFLAGEIFSRAREYHFLQQQAYTRFNAKQKTGRFLWEMIAGYGLKPWRVLVVLGIVFALVSSFFSIRLHSVGDGLLLASGAFLTFGAKTELFVKLSLADHVIYIASAFFGVSMIALFVTVLASVLLKDR